MLSSKTPKGRRSGSSATAAASPPGWRGNDSQKPLPCASPARLPRTVLSGLVSQKPEGPAWKMPGPSWTLSVLPGAGLRTISARLPSSTLRRSTASSRKYAWPAMSWQMLFLTSTPLVACSTMQRFANLPDGAVADGVAGGIADELAAGVAQQVPVHRVARLHARLAHAAHLDAVDDDLRLQAHDHHMRAEAAAPMAVVGALDDDVAASGWPPARVRRARSAREPPAACSRARA